MILKRLAAKIGIQGPQDSETHFIIVYLKLTTISIKEKYSHSTKKKPENAWRGLDKAAN